MEPVLPTTVTGKQSLCLYPDPQAFSFMILFSLPSYWSGGNDWVARWVLGCQPWGPWARSCRNQREQHGELESAPLPPSPLSQQYKSSGAPHQIQKALAEFFGHETIGSANITTGWENVYSSVLQGTSRKFWCTAQGRYFWQCKEGPVDQVRAICTAYYYYKAIGPPGGHEWGLKLPSLL